MLLLKSGLQRAAIGELASSAEQIHRTAQQMLSGGEWTVDLCSETPTCKVGATDDAQCTITMANEDFEAMLENPQLGMQLYFQGKLKVAGDPMLATRMTKLLSLGQ